MSASTSSSTADSGASAISKSGFLRREDILGKPVVGQDAKIVGTVKDLAVSVDGKVALQVEKKDASPGSESSDIFVRSDEILAVGDFVLLRSSSAKAGASLSASSVAPFRQQSESAAPPPFLGKEMGKACPRCNFSNSQTSRFCVKCGSLMQ